MEENKVQNYLKGVLENRPSDWLRLTTHRLDIYDESQAKTQFLDQFESLYQSNNFTAAALYDLPTAYDYIRLGHPLSSILEWIVAKNASLHPQNIISFSSKVTPLLAILRKNLQDKKKTTIYYTSGFSASFEAEIVKDIYGYDFEWKQVGVDHPIHHAGESSAVYISEPGDMCNFDPSTSVAKGIDFHLNIDAKLGSILIVHGEQNDSYISEIQHVRRRETIAMTPADCLSLLKKYAGLSSSASKDNSSADKASVLASIKEITSANTPAVVASSGLSMQYAITMGLIHEAKIHHPGKDVKIIVPTNCYGGTNDQARRVAACLDHVQVVDLLVDGDHDMVDSLEKVLDNIAEADAVPYIIAEIPTNPRVEVPDMQALKAVLTKVRTTSQGKNAIDPVFILDQTFCPNIHFLGEDSMLANTRTIAYVSGSKFPSGGRCTAGYCVANQKAKDLMQKIELHLSLCDNEATDLQYAILAEQLPSMNQRIKDAYRNTRAFVNFIMEILPTAKINFVSEELASKEFTPSVFSLDLPTKGDTDEERESYKRALNLKLIDLMIKEIPSESKYCVSYGQLKGCYWTIPATSTQGTTKEGDKDYIVRASLSGNMDLERHKKVFADFVKDI
jgi:cystathionine beta-lyase/cystathionine gamma-synthase